MSNLTYHLIGMTSLVAAFYMATRLLAPIAREPGFGTAGWHLALFGIALLGAPFAGLLLFELVSGRALGLGFSVIRRTEAPRVYWGWVAFHGSLLLVAVAATATYFLTR